MKKVLSIILAAGMVALISCGPSAEEKAAMEKAKADSIANVEKARMDSMEAINQANIDKMKADSAASAAMNQARLDSVEAANKKLQKKASDIKKKEDQTKKSIEN